MPLFFMKLENNGGREEERERERERERGGGGGGGNPVDKREEPFSLLCVSQFLNCFYRFVCFLVLNRFLFSSRNWKTT